ncbi:hypothetical protein PHYPSEUDO_003343 [Phytophthora pseudosyringae]|uniref:P-type ATPase A domain-containing protein n=1 Tax=Phytophthora pseudosyringae TaxID=221518 RepID=A0A8T1VU19_9STRA|nr:hypothetical protein PHYPSEUDO_003343 [Phytophthora pseudosyringae]
MLVVIEAKQSSIQQDQYQLMAMMEAVRIHNKQLDKKIDSIKAIITDFQNWMFVGRSTDMLQKEELGAAIPVKKEEIEPGDVVPADGLAFNTRELKVDESALTGEPELMRKGDALLMQASHEEVVSITFFSGTRVMEGFAKMLVLCVGEPARSRR